MSIMILKRTHSQSLWIIGALIFMLWGISCKSGPTSALKKNQKITIGSFGGFAGTYKEYTILPDGLLLLKTKSNGEGRPISKLEQTTVTQFFSLLSDLDADASAINNPGNMTYFIGLHEDSKNLVWIWGGGEEPANQIQSIYRSLSKLCRSQEHPIR